MQVYRINLYLNIQQMLLYSVKWSWKWHSNIFYMFDFMNAYWYYVGIKQLLNNSLSWYLLIQYTIFSKILKKNFFVLMRHWSFCVFDIWASEHLKNFRNFNFEWNIQSIRGPLEMFLLYLIHGRNMNIFLHKYEAD